MNKSTNEHSCWQGYTIRIEKDGSITLRIPSGRAIGWAGVKSLHFWIDCYCTNGATVDSSRLALIKDTEARFAAARELANAPDFKNEAQSTAPAPIRVQPMLPYFRAP